MPSLVVTPDGVFAGLPGDSIVGNPATLGGDGSDATYLQRYLDPNENFDAMAAGFTFPATDGLVQGSQTITGVILRVRVTLDVPDSSNQNIPLVYLFTHDLSARLASPGIVGSPEIDGVDPTTPQWYAVAVDALVAPLLYQGGAGVATTLATTLVGQTSRYFEGQLVITYDGPVVDPTPPPSSSVFDVPWLRVVQRSDGLDLGGPPRAVQQATNTDSLRAGTAVT